MASLQLSDKEISFSTNCNAIIVDDHLMVAQAIATVVSMIADIEIVGIAKDVPEACKLIESQSPRNFIFRYKFKE
jgi:DNA-binding NarL/FixJ family response regulator